MPLPTEKRNQGQQDLAVQIQGVWVRPGDWLYADEDGMVVSAVKLDLTGERPQGGQQHAHQCDGESGELQAAERLAKDQHADQRGARPAASP
jgi:regulator of RNase E activity RraA